DLGPAVRAARGGLHRDVRGGGRRRCFRGGGRVRARHPGAVRTRIDGVVMTRHRGWAAVVALALAAAGCASTAEQRSSVSVGPGGSAGAADGLSVPSAGG